jgi:hypothetical protein
LYDNQLEGSLPWFQSLERLWIQQNLLTGMDDVHHATMSTLTMSLIVYDDAISGPYQELGTLPPVGLFGPGLEYLDARDHSGMHVGLAALKSLVLHDCQLTGTLPTMTSKLTGDNFRHGWLHSNRLSGFFPANLGWNWRNLTSLLLHE